MQRLRNSAQFQAAMSGGTLCRSPHFSLHRVLLPAVGPVAALPAQALAVPLPVSAQKHNPANLRRLDKSLTPAKNEAFDLFAGSPLWLGALVPKRWAKRAVTRNTIKRQIYAVSAEFESRIEQRLSGDRAVHVVRLRQTFSRDAFPSATSVALKAAVRAELLALFAPLVSPLAGAALAPGVGQS
jgi:ribonuclease P protein component